MIDKIPRKNSKCNKKLYLLKTSFGTAHKSFYCWCSIDKKVLVVSAMDLNAGIGIDLKCGIDTSLLFTTWQHCMF